MVAHSAALRKTRDLILNAAGEHTLRAALPEAALEGLYAALRVAFDMALVNRRGHGVRSDVHPRRIWLETYVRMSDVQMNGLWERT